MGTASKAIGGTIVVLLFVSMLFFLIRGCSVANHMVNDAANTVEQQFSPSVLLQKYEWFKDASAALDAKQSDLGVYEARFKTIEKRYANGNPWSRSDTEQYNIWQSEYLGLKASYNDLAGQYNAAMAKFNYAFCNAGQMPQGCTIPLPREYKPYINE